jgi:hypothetical protein
MDKWVANDAEPPPSQYPKIADGKLVPLSRLQFPKIDDLSVPTRPQRAYRVDYGPEFRTVGIISIEPPKVGEAFPTLVPQVNSDGNETSGIRMPDIQVPLGTYTGWNYRAAAIGAPDELFSMVGSYIPFERTKAEKEKDRDPRLSVDERYHSREDYLKQFEGAARKLVAGGYLLEQDVPKLVERATSEWDRLGR